MKRSGFKRKKFEVKMIDGVAVAHGYVGEFGGYVLDKSPLLLKPHKPMKRGKLKKKSKQSISLIQRKIWEQCKRIIRAKYGNVCYTCQATNLIGSNWHTGHMLSKASLGAYLKYDLRLIRPQCYHCNINLGGAGADFYLKMLEEIGPEEMKKLQQDRQITVKAYDYYQKILAEYEKL